MTLPSVPGLTPTPTHEGAPDDRCPLAQVIAELQEAVMQRQGHKVPLAVCLLPIVEEQTAGATRQEHHLQCHLLPGVRWGQMGASQWPFALQSGQGLGGCFPSSTPSVLLTLGPAQRCASLSAPGRRSRGSQPGRAGNNPARRLWRTRQQSHGRPGPPLGFPVTPLLCEPQA